MQTTADVLIDASKLREHLRIELGDMQPMPIAVALSGSALRVTFTVSFADGEPLARDVDISDLPLADRERVLALAIVEALRTSGRTPPQPQPQPPPPPAVVRQPSPPAPARPPAWHPGYAVAFGGRLLPHSTSLGLEPRLGIWIRHRSGLRLDLSASYLWSRATDPLGSVSVHVIAGSLLVGYDRNVNARLALHVGPRLDVGPALGRGSAEAGATERSLDVLQVATVAELGARLKLASGVAVAVALDVGWIPRGLDLQADGRSVLRTEGVTSGVRIGLSTP